MRQIRICLLLVLAVLCPPMSGPLHAGQVITDEVRAWAKQVAAEEARIGVPEGRRTLAVLPFFQESGDEAYGPLGKGLAVMLETDLKKIGDLEVVTRVYIEALIQELSLARSELVQKASAPRLGRLFRARWVVGGTFGLKEVLLSIGARVVDTPKAALLGQPTAEDALGEFFRMEKALAHNIIELLQIRPTAEEEEAISEPFQYDLEAFMAFCRGLDASDHGLYQQAADEYSRALAIDPRFGLAQDALQELSALKLVTPPPRIPPEAVFLDLRPEVGSLGTLRTKDEQKRLVQPQNVRPVANLPPGFVGPRGR
jgi:TolB-like protein